MTLKISSDNIQSSGVSAGSYTNANITVNEAGQITSASNGVAGSGGSGGSGGTGTFFTYTYTGDGTTTTFAGGSGMTVHNVIIAENGVVQYPTTDYTVSGSNIVFTTAPASGVLVQIRILAGGGGSGTPKITSIAVTDSSYNNLDDTAVNISGGYIKIAGTDFAAGCQVVVGSQVATSVTFISSTEVRAQVPAQTAGTYTVYLTNSDGGVAIRVNALNYSATPTWTTTSPLPGSVKNTAISLQLAATSNSSVTYTLQAGSTLPSGLTLSSGGLLSGTTPNISSETTYNFTIVATDAEAQDTPQAFQITISVGDLYYELVTLHLPGTGTNGAQNNTFLDGSTNNFTITRNGNTTQGTFSPFSQTGWGNYLPTTSERLTTASSSSDFSFGTGNFTVEGFVNLSSASNCMVFQMSTAATGYNPSNTNSVCFYIGGGVNAGKLEIYANNAAFASTNVLVTSSDIGKWYHFAIVRSSGSTTVYWNGSAVAGLTSIADSANYTMTYCVIGTVYNNTYSLQGYLSNFRVLKGTAQYSGASITVPTAPFATGTTNQVLLTCQANRFVDSNTATTAKTITVSGSPTVVAFSPFNPTASWSAATNGGSGYFDGSGDYLTTPNVTAFQFGSGDFTVEMWVYLATPIGTKRHLFHTGNNLTGQFNMRIETSGKVFVFANDSGAFSLLSSTALTPYQWYHIAFSRSGSTNQIFLNGAVDATATNSYSYSGSGNVQIGYWTGDTSEFMGYMTDTRVVKGTAVYTAAFTPPTAPLTAITNTSLLLNFTNAGIYDATSKNDLETVGDAKISTAQSKWGGSSIAFDGTSDYLVAPSSQFWTLGSTEDFTIEFWFYTSVTVPISGSTPSTLISNYPDWNTWTNRWAIATNDNKIKWYDHTGSAAIASNNFTYSVWNHVAVVRSSNSIKMYINGTQEGSTQTTNQTYTSTEKLYVGLVPSGSAFNGYISDLRITKGYARYTANFTAPTAAFPAQ